MSLLLSMPGRHGDVLWGMAVARAIAEANPGEAIDLVISGKYGGLAPLLCQQPYLRHVIVHSSWEVVESAPMSPRVPPPFLSPNDTEEPYQYIRQVELGYRGWPTAPLPQYIYETVRAEHPDLKLAPLELERPWITVQGPGPPAELVVGFSDEWFELKAGIVTLIERGPAPMLVLYPQGSRWHTERPRGSWPGMTCDWTDAALALRNADVFLGCCSALHVLAVALGKPCVIMEPNPQRHHEIFWPLGTTGRVKLVLGSDGKPTFDARHVRETLEAVLQEAR